MRTRNLLLVSLALPVASVEAQEQAADTSLAARLERAERAIEILRTQVAEATAQRVESRSRQRIELSGRVLVNAFFNNGKVNNSDVPQFVMPPDPPALPASAAGATVRQSQVALTAFASNVGGAAFAGELDVDFFGGQQPSSGGRTFPLMRLRRMRAELSWPHAWLLIGQEAPPIAEVNPSSLAQVGFTGFAGSGNLWLWIPQIRAGISAGTSVRLGLEAAALAPTSGDPQGGFATQPDRAERSRRPFAQGRVRLLWDEAQTGGEISIGGHYGWLAVSLDTLVVTKAAALSATLSARFIELRGEAFVGEALGGLGGGGIGQSLGPANQPVRSKGGWAQLNVKPAAGWELGGGYGLDDPEDLDLNPLTARLKNTSWEGHVHWRPAPLVFGLEFRRLETTYGAGTGRLWVNHLNVAAGFEF
ncbi:MAG TPA: hypothetical protein VNL18_01770 [Gemmatimonadales bacterium]|nr:hypothetical protein [Gemmatimonadales bacterium]